MSQEGDQPQEQASAQPDDQSSKLENQVAQNFEPTDMTLAQNTLADVRRPEILPDEMFRGVRPPEQRTSSGERLPQADTPEAILRQLPYINQHRERLETMVQQMSRALAPEGGGGGNMEQAKNSVSEILRHLPPEKRQLFGQWARRLDEAARAELNPERQRQLKELAENLKVLERAPGFMRGNLALAMYQWAGQASNPAEMRNRLNEAQRAMQDTVQNYPALADDPNFRNRAQAIDQQYGDKLRTAAAPTDGGHAHEGIMDRVGKLAQEVREGRLPLLYNPEQRLAPIGPEGSKEVRPTPDQRPPEAPTNSVQYIEKGEQAFNRYREAVEQQVRQGVPREQAARAALTPEIIREFEQSITAADASPAPNGLSHARVMQTMAAIRALQQQTPVEVGGQRISWTQAHQGWGQQTDQLIQGLQLDNNQKNLLVAHIRRLDASRTPENYRTSQEALRSFINSNQALRPLANDARFQGLLQSHQSLMTPMFPHLQQLAAAERLATADDSRGFNRLLFATALAEAGQTDQAKRHLTDAYARTISQGLRTQMASEAIRLGVAPNALADAALARHESQSQVQGQSMEPAPPVGELIAELNQFFALTVQSQARGQPPDVRSAAAGAMTTFGPLYERLARVATANRTRVEGMEQPLLADIRTQTASILQDRGPQAQEILALQQRVFAPLSNPAHMNLVGAFMQAGDESTRNQVRTEMQRTLGEPWLREFDQWRNLAGDKAVHLFAQETRKTTFMAARQQSQLEQFAARRSYAENLRAAGNNEAAKAQLTQALRDAPNTVQGLAAASPEIQALARGLGVDMSPYAGLVPSEPGPRPGPGPGLGLEQTIPGQDRALQPLQGVPREQALDPRFANVSDQQLRERRTQLVSSDPRGNMDANLVLRNIAEVRPIYEEMIRRADSVPHPENPGVLVRPTVEQIFDGIRSRTEILRANIDPTTQRPLTEMQRVQMYQQVLSTMEAVRFQILMRQDYARALTIAGQMQDAERYYKEAKELSDRIPRELVTQVYSMVENAVADSTMISNAPLPGTNVGRGDYLLGILGRLKGPHPSQDFANLSISTRVALGKFYMGPKQDGNDPYGGAVLLYGNRAGIRPELAVQNLQEATDLLQRGRNVNILDPAKFSQDVDLAGALHMATEILPSNLTRNLGFSQSNTSTLANILAAGTGVAVMTLTRGRWRETHLQNFARIGAVAALPTGVRAGTMWMAGEGEHPMTSARNALAVTFLAGVGYKMMVRGPSSQFNVFEGTPLHGQLTNLTNRTLEHTARIPILNRLNNVGAPLNDLTGVPAAQQFERSGHSLSSLARAMDDFGPNMAPRAQHIRDLMSRVGENTRVDELIRRRTVFDSAARFQVEAAAADRFRNYVTSLSRTNTDTAGAVLELRKVFGGTAAEVQTQVRALTEAIGEHNVNLLRQQYARSTEAVARIEGHIIQPGVPGRVLLDETFNLAGLTHERAANLLNLMTRGEYLTPQLAQNLGARRMPFGPSDGRFSTMQDLQNFPVAAKRALERIQAIARQVENTPRTPPVPPTTAAGESIVSPGPMIDGPLQMGRRFGRYTSLNTVEESLNIARRAGSITADEHLRLVETARMFNLHTRMGLDMLLRTTFRGADDALAARLFPHANFASANMGDDLATVALRNPRLFEGSFTRNVTDYLLNRIPQAEQAAFSRSSMFARRTPATDVQVFERALYRAGNNQSAITNVGQLRQLYDDAVGSINSIRGSIGSHGDDVTLSAAFPDNAAAVARANSIGINNIGQLKQFVQQFPADMPASRVFNTLYPHIDDAVEAGTTLGTLVRGNPQALSGNGFNMIAGGITAGERQVLGTASVLQDNIAVNNGLMLDRLRTANIHTVNEFQSAVGDAVKTQLEGIQAALKGGAEIAALPNKAHRDLLRAFGFGDDVLALPRAEALRRVEALLANEALPQISMQRLFPGLANLRAPGGQLLSEVEHTVTDAGMRRFSPPAGPHLRVEPTQATAMFEAAVERTPNIFSGPGLGMLAEHAEFRLLRPGLRPTDTVTAFNLSGEAGHALTPAPLTPGMQVWSNEMSRLRNFTGRLQDYLPNRLNPDTATLGQIIRGERARNYHAGLVVLGGYRTLVTTPDNMAAGDSLSQALINAHFPNVEASKHFGALSFLPNVLVSTPIAPLLIPVQSGFLARNMSLRQSMSGRPISGMYDWASYQLSRGIHNTHPTFGGAISGTLALAGPLYNQSGHAVASVLDHLPYIGGGGPFTNDRVIPMYLRTQRYGFQNAPVNSNYTSLEDYRRQRGIPAPEPQAVQPLERPVRRTSQLEGPGDRPGQVTTDQVIPAVADAADRQRLEARNETGLQLPAEWQGHLSALQTVTTAMSRMQDASYLVHLHEASGVIDALAAGQQGPTREQLARTVQIMQMVAAIPQLAQSQEHRPLLTAIQQVSQALSQSVTSGTAFNAAQVQEALNTVKQNFAQYKLNENQLAEIRTQSTQAMNEARGLAARYHVANSAEANFLAAQQAQVTSEINTLTQSIFGQATPFAGISAQAIMARASHPQINELRTAMAKFELLANVRHAHTLLSTQAAVATSNGIMVASAAPDANVVTENTSVFGPSLAAVQENPALSAYSHFVTANNNPDFRATPEAQQLASVVTPDVERLIGDDQNSREILRLMQQASGRGDTQEAYQALRQAARLADNVDIGSLASQIVNSSNPETQAALQARAHLVGIARLKYAQMAYRLQDFSEAQSYMIKARAQYGNQLEAMLQPNTYLDQGLDRDQFLTGAFTQISRNQGYDPAAMGTSLNSFFEALRLGQLGATTDNGSPGAQALLQQVRTAFNSQRTAIEGSLRPLLERENQLKARLQELGVPFEGRQAFLRDEPNKTSEKYLQVETINRELELIGVTRNVRAREVEFERNRLRLAEGMYDAAQGNYAAANQALREVRDRSPELAANKDLDLDGKIRMTETGLTGFWNRNWRTVGLVTAGVAAAVVGAIASATVVGAVGGAPLMALGAGLIAGATTGYLVGGSVNAAFTRAVTGEWGGFHEGGKEGALAGLLAPVGMASRLLPVINSTARGAQVYNFSRPFIVPTTVGATMAANDVSHRWNERSSTSNLLEFGGRTLMYGTMMHFGTSATSSMFGVGNRLLHPSFTQAAAVGSFSEMRGSMATTLSQFSAGTTWRQRMMSAPRLAPAASYGVAIELGRDFTNWGTYGIDALSERWHGPDHRSLGARYLVSEGEGLLAPAIAGSLNWWSGHGLNPNNRRDHAWMTGNHHQIIRTGDSFHALRQRGFNAQNFIPSASYGPLMRRPN